MGSFVNVMGKINQANATTAQLFSVVGRGAIISDYVATTNGFGNFLNVAAAVPYWGVAASALGLTHTITRFLRDITRTSGYLFSPNAVGDLVDTIGNIQLLTKSLDAVATGTVVPVYYGFAICNGINFAKFIYFYTKTVAEIERHDKGTRHEDGKKCTHCNKLLNNKTVLQNCIILSALNCIGFSLLTVGNPVGFAFLGLATVRSSYLLLAENIEFVRKAGRNAEYLLSEVGKLTVIADYVATAKDLGNFTTVVTSAIPIWGIASGALGLVNKVTGLIDDVSITKGKRAENDYTWPRTNKVERTVIDICSIGAYINLLNSSLDALATGAIAPVYYGFVLTNGISFATNLYLYVKAELAIKAECTRLNLSRDELVRDAKNGALPNLKTLISASDKYLCLTVTHGLNCAGFAFLTVGNPIGFAFLGLSTFIGLQQVVVPVLAKCKFFSRAKQGDIVDDFVDLVPQTPASK